MSYYRIKFKMGIPKNVVKELMNKQLNNQPGIACVQSGFYFDYIVQEKNALLCYETMLRTAKEKLKGYTVTVKDERAFIEKIANVDCLKYMHNAKKGDKFEIIPLYHLLDENCELQFEIRKTTKEKYDKFIEKKAKKLEKHKKNQKNIKS